MSTPPVLYIRVELVSGRGEELDPPPGRIVVVPQAMSLGRLARAIDELFGRWSPGHLHAFSMADGRTFVPMPEDPSEGENSFFTMVGALGLSPGDEFEYVFDFGDEWQHVCRVEEVDPRMYEDFADGSPDSIFAVDGWGSLPDQHGRVTADAE